MALSPSLVFVSLIASVYGTTSFIPVQTGAPANFHGSLTIIVDGHLETLDIVSPGSGNFENNVSISEDGNSFTMSGGGQVQFASQYQSHYTPDMFAKFKLLGKEFIYTVDRSTVGCSCNSAIYFVDMPGYDENQNPDASKFGNYYCDCDKVGGSYCPDMDVSEANAYTMATTIHSCSAPAGKHYSKCDPVGCGVNVFNANPKAYCPDVSCTINTSKPYTHAIAFQETNGQLSAIKNTLTQGSQSFIFYSCIDASYLKDMTNPIGNDGLVPIISLWGNSYDTMAWLDSMTGCTGDCDINAASSTFSDFKINTL